MLHQIKVWTNCILVQGKSARVCAPASGPVTCHLVQALSGDVVVLIDPLAIALEVDLGGR